MEGAMKKGLIEKDQITQKRPREEGVGQRPKAKKEKCKDERGSFTIK